MSLKMEDPEVGIKAHMSAKAEGFLGMKSKTLRPDQTICTW